MINSQEPQENEPQIRRGLVLEGGGAKGAWQFGALKALHEKGVKFNYVAGTSVGALNGALWAAGRLDLGNELWGDIRRSKVFKLRLHNTPLFLIGLFARIFYAYVQGFISPGKSPYLLPEMSPRFVRIILGGLMSVPAIIVAIFPFLIFIHLITGATIATINDRKSFMIVVLMPFLLLWFVIRRREAGGRKWLFFTSSFLASAFLLIHLLFYAIRANESSSNKGTEDNLLFYVALVEMPLFLWILALIPLLIFCIAIVFRRLNLSIFKVDPLEMIISKLVAGGLHIPMFATVAREIEYIDPDDLRFRYDSELKFSDSVPHSAIIPDYLEVKGLSPENQLNTLLATSALPLGITPRRKAGHILTPSEIREALEKEKKEAEELSKSFLYGMYGKGFQKRSRTQKAFLMDGGVVDNIPWYPFIEDIPCDEIYIVRCNPVKESEGLDDSTMKQTWKERNRHLRVVTKSLEFDKKLARDISGETGTSRPANFIGDQFGNIRVIECENPEIYARVKGGEQKDIKNDPPIEIPLREPNGWKEPKHVVIIAPDAPLGNFLTGTLNFSPEVARMRVDAGYEKASEILKKLAPEHK